MVYSGCYITHRSLSSLHHFKKHARTHTHTHNHHEHTAVGDAFSDMLFVEAILHVRGWTISDWNEIYVNTPSRQSTVQVPDRTVVVPNSTERRVLGPPGLQEAIDALVENAESPARAFVRPSGTEDIVRVYAEAKTQEGADKLAQAVSDAVTKFAGGGSDNGDADDDEEDAKTSEASSKI